MKVQGLDWKVKRLEEKMKDVSISGTTRMQCMHATTRKVKYQRAEAGQKLLECMPATEYRNFANSKIKHRSFSWVTTHLSSASPFICSLYIILGRKSVFFFVLGIPPISIILGLVK